MHQFYLNDCLGSTTYGLDDLAAGLVTVVNAFNRLVRSPKLRVSKGWVYEKEAASMVIGGDRLEDIVKNMPDKEARRLFFMYNIHYPIHEHLSHADEDTLLDANYQFGGSDAMNIAIAASNKAILLTLPVADYLMQNLLEIKPATAGYDNINVPNLHGGKPANEVYICRELLDRNYTQLSDFEKLDSLAPVVKFSEPFRDRFKKLTSNDKQSIFDRIDEARDGQMLQPLRCNGTVIKHVEEHVSELRIVNPVDIRVYFHEDGETLYFGKLAFKSEYVGKNDQHDDIQKAEAIIKEMMS